MYILDRMLEDARQVYERVTGQPYTREGLRGKPIDVPRGADPEGYVYQQMAHLKNLLAAKFSPFWSSTPGWMPVLDCYDTRDALVVRIELPGLTKDEVTVSVGESLLVVKGERFFRVDDPAATVLARERFYGPFERWIPLPTRVRTDEVQANHRDGVLEVRLAKVQPAPDMTQQVRVE